MLYENGNLRYISANKFEVLRMIYSAVRDREWLTVRPVISEEEFDIRPDSFRINYMAHYLTDEINFLAHYSIIGNADNSLIFTLEGEALEFFEKNRIGFCLLHPIEVNRGENCEIVHTNNKTENGSFPFFISPGQPFRDIKSMKWKRKNVSCSVDFFGDVFETEDQRNWTDASYKTYCTPLDHPFPVEVHKGEKIFQKIELKVSGGECAENNKSEQILISLNRERILPLPSTGIGRSTRPQPLTERELKVIKKIKFDHYRVEIYFSRNGWISETEIGLKEAASIGCKAELALFFDDNYEVQIRKFIILIAESAADIVLILLFHESALATPYFLFESVAQKLKEALPGVQICCGTNANFAQLNRARPLSTGADCICYSIQPQEHAADNFTLVENLQSLRDTIESTRSFSDRKEIWISPVNIQRRFNANVSAFEKFDDSTNLPPQVDSRLMSLFGGCWTTGSLKYLIGGGIKGVTFFETVGERGIIQGDINSRWQDDFNACKGMIFPVYFVFKYILGNYKYGMADSISSHPLRVDSIAITNGMNMKVILVNYTSIRQEVIMSGFSGMLILKTLNEVTYGDAVCNADWLDKTESVAIVANEPLLLEPFSINFIEG